MCAGICAGVYAHFPAPVGFEGVGIVDALGPGVRALASSLDADSRQLMDAISELVREEVFETPPCRRYSLDKVGAAVTQAESRGRQGKVLLIPSLS
jgi:NADPH:quinone reductase-like Zn-dependent oxidoreductase